MRLNRIAAMVLCLGATSVLAQSTEVAKHSCEPRPAYPGLKAMKSDVEVKAFEASMKAYKECIIAYISARKSSVKAHEAAENAAAKEYNDTMGTIRTAQESALKEVEASKKSAEKNEPASPRAPAKY